MVRVICELSAAEVQGPLKGLGSFWVLMLKYAFSHILETLFLSFLISTSAPKGKTSTLNILKKY